MFPSLEDVRRTRGVLSRQLFLKSGQGNPYQSITTFPELPLFIASKPSR